MLNEMSGRVSFVLVGDAASLKVLGSNPIAVIPKQAPFEMGSSHPTTSNIALSFQFQLKARALLSRNLFWRVLSNKEWGGRSQEQS